MAKEKGFANFTPEQAAAFKKEEKATKPQDPYAGQEQDKQTKERSKNEVK